VDRIDDESVWLRSPDLADAFVGLEAAERLEPAGEVVGGDEVSEVGAKLIVAFVVENLIVWFIRSP
jgi:hypothetical protein